MVRHNQMRTMDELVVAEAPARRTDYPVKIAPSRLVELLSPAWSYRSSDHGTDFDETIEYGRAMSPQVEQRLRRIAEQLEFVAPRLPGVLTAERFRAALRTNGSEWWSESMWIEDLSGVIDD